MADAGRTTSVVIEVRTCDIHTGVTSSVSAPLPDDLQAWLENQPDIPLLSAVGMAIRKAKDS